MPRSSKNAHSNPQRYINPDLQPRVQFSIQAEFAFTSDYYRRPSFEGQLLVDHFDKLMEDASTKWRYPISKIEWTPEQPHAVFVHFTWTREITYVQTVHAGEWARLEIQKCLRAYDKTVAA